VESAFNLWGAVVERVLCFARELVSIRGLSEAIVVASIKGNVGKG
jgi:hypothetical protein